MITVDELPVNVFQLARYISYVQSQIKQLDLPILSYSEYHAEILNDILETNLKEFKNEYRQD